jgi:putative peptidoglycan lipid II flippase
MSVKQTARGSSETSLARSTIQVTALVFLSRISGYLRMLALAYAMGVTRFADAFNLANLMPNMIYELVIGGVVASVLIPVISEHLVKGEREEANRVLSSILNLALISMGFIVVLGVLFPQVFIYTQTFLSGEKQPEIKQLMAFFFRFFAPQIVFYTIVAIFTGLLYAERRFAAPNYAPIFNSIIVAAVAVVFPIIYQVNHLWGQIWLAAGTTGGVIAMALALWPAMRGLNFKWRLTLGLRHPSVRKLGLLAVPVFGYVLINQIGLTVTNNLVWRYDKGITALAFAWTMFQLSSALFSSPITNTLFPNLSDHANQGDMHNFKKDLSLGIRAIGLLIIPAALGILVLAGPLVNLLFRYGKFDQGAVYMVAPILQLYALGTFSFAVWTLLTRAFYALQDSKTPMYINASGVAVSIPLNIILVSLLGVKGVALAHALTYSFISALAISRLRIKIGPLGARRIIRSIAKQLFAAIAMATVVFFWSREIADRIIFSNVRIEQVFVVITSVIFGVFIFMAGCRLFRVEEINFINNIIKRKKNILIAR